MMMEDLLRELGIAEIHVCPDIESASAVAATAELDCAVLDYHVRGGDCGVVADILADRGIPFIFSTGSDIASLDERHRGRLMIAKPFADDDFKMMVLDAVTQARSGMPATDPAA